MEPHHPEDRSSTSEQPILIHVANGQAFIWTVAEAQRLRSEYRICAVLTGTLPQAAQQNVFLGLPLQLLPEEVVLLMKHGFANIVFETPDALVPSEPLYKWKRLMERSSGAQASEKNLKLSESAMHKRLERQGRKEVNSAGSENSEPRKLISDSKKINETSAMFQVASASSANPWSNQTLLESLEQARDAGVWSYPSTADEQARCSIFEDLWSKGYYMGNGLRFGGDWLVYPGDPLRFHSHYIASVHVGAKEAFDPMFLVAHGRLGTGTKKAHLLCGWDERNKEVFYFSVEWAAFG